MNAPSALESRYRLPGWLFIGFLILTVALALVPFVADGHYNGGKPHYESASTADARDSGAEKSVFSPSTPKIYVNYYVENVGKGARLRAVWWADKVEGVQNNSRITSSDATPGAGSFFGAFSYSKPPAGWPAGTYHVDLYIEDRLEKAVSFRIAK